MLTFISYVILWSSLLFLFNMTSYFWSKSKTAQNAWFWFILASITFIGLMFCGYEIIDKLLLGV